MSDKAKSLPYDGLTRTLLELERDELGIVKNARRPGIGTTVKGLAGDVHPFLMSDRLTWFDAYTHNQESRVDGSIKLEEFFAGEFSALGKSYTWDARPVDSDANLHPEIPFYFLSSEPGYRPLVVHRNIQSDDESGTLLSGRRPRNVVVLQAVEGQQPDPKRQRPSLYICFNEPQRAVGLSFGFDAESDSGVTIPSEYCRLIAYAAGGRRIAESSAGQLASGRQNVRVIPAGHGSVHIGVTSKDAEIDYVELEFSQLNEGEEGGTPDFIPYAQLVSRVWLEPFPSCVVKQGSFDLTGRSDTVTVARESISLPYHCDRAMVALRGFGLTLKDKALEIHRLGIGVGIDSYGEDTIRLAARVDLGAEEAVEFTARVDYSIIAWDSLQMDISTTSGTVFNSDVASNIVNPCAAEGVPCGQFSAFLQSFKVSSDEDSEIEEFGINSLQPHPNGDGAHLTWEVQTTLEGGDIENLKTVFSGGIIGGESVSNPQLIGVEIGQEEVSGPVGLENLIITGSTDFNQDARVNFREDREFINFFSDNRPHNVGIAVHGDMCVASLKEFLFLPDDEIHHLDVEVIGSRFDGEQFFFKLGAGTSTDPDDHDDLFEWKATMQVVAFNKRRSKPKQIRVQDIRFERATPGVISLFPDQIGLIINDGQDPLIITDIHVEGVGADRFRLIGAVLPLFQATNIRNIGFDPRSFHLEEFSHRRPVIIHSGEKLVIGGAVFPENSDDLSIRVVLSTNDAQHSTVVLEATADLVESQPEAEPLPHSMDFGSITIGQSRAKNLLLASIGIDPLLVTSMGFDSASPVFKYELVNAQFDPAAGLQLEPGEVWPTVGRIVITVNPTAAGTHQTNFKFTTNAGEVLVPIKVVAV